MHQAKLRRQRTLGKVVEFSGIGIHTCAEVTLRFVPAPVNTGIIFRRIDLPGAPEIPALVNYVVDTARSTTLGIGDVRIHTVEHVLAAVRAFRIDNLFIELTNLEPPIADGSAQAFVELIDQAKIVEQEETVTPYYLDTPLYWSQGAVHLIALPHDKLQMSYTLHYPESQILQAQYVSFEIDEDTFRKEIATCRTFSTYREVDYMMKQGLIQGGSLKNAVIIKDEAVLSYGGLRFPNEMARHKLLDMVGDFSLLGFELIAHLIAIRAGHPSNFCLVKKIHQHMIHAVPQRKEKAFSYV